MEFKEILKDYLVTNGLNQTQFAKIINVKQSQVSEWLSGKVKPNYDTLKVILTKCDESAEYWFDIT